MSRYWSPGDPNIPLVINPKYAAKQGLCEKCSGLLPRKGKHKCGTRKYVVAHAPNEETIRVKKTEAADAPPPLLKGPFLQGAEQTDRLKNAR
jgi:hypothetical protein